MISDKKAENIFLAVQDIFELQKKIRKIRTWNYIFFNEMHHSKMWYLLLKHSLFDQKYNPFLLCSCNYGEGVMNPDYKCKMMT